MAVSRWYNLEDLNKSMQNFDVPNPDGVNGSIDKRVKAKEIIDKLKELVLSKTPKTQKEKLEQNVLISHLDNVYESVIKQAIDLAVSKSEIETNTANGGEKPACAVIVRLRRTAINS